MTNTIDASPLAVAAPISFKLAQFEERMEMTIIQLPCGLDGFFNECAPPYKLCFT